MKQHQVRDMQRKMNQFVRHRLHGVGPILVDGKLGPSTRGRIRTVKFYLGYTRANANSSVTTEFVWRLNHPLRIRSQHRKFDQERVLRGKKRRVKQRKAARAAEEWARKHGVSRFDGVLVANWLVPYLNWARRNGWQGRLVSGYRTPAYSEGLCFQMCGKPSCPGRCAGRASNHAKRIKPFGAMDLSDYVTFGKLMQRCPLSPRIFNALGDADPVHFSSTGR